jgi:predicted negative regulator of RcsB-dependent stress response
VHCYEQALTLFRELDHHNDEAFVLTRLGAVHLDRGERAAARAAWQRAVQLLDRFEHRSTDDVRAKLRRLASG